MKLDIGHRPTSYLIPVDHLFYKSQKCPKPILECFVLEPSNVYFRDVISDIIDDIITLIHYNLYKLTMY